METYNKIITLKDRITLSLKKEYKKPEVRVDQGNIKVVSYTLNKRDLSVVVEAGYQSKPVRVAVAEKGSFQQDNVSGEPPIESILDKNKESFQQEEVSSKEEELDVSDLSVKEDTKKPIWKKVFNKEKEVVKDAREEIANPVALRPIFPGKNACCIEDVGYTRGIGVLKLLEQYEYRKDINYSKHFDLISGVGNAAIIVYALAMNMPIWRLEQFWRNEWRDVYSGGLDSSLRSALGGHPRSRKKALKVLREFFSFDGQGRSPMLHKNLFCEVFVPVVNADKKVNAYTKTHTPEAAIAQAVVDTLSPLDFPSEELVKGEPFNMPFDQSTEFILSLSNRHLELVSFGAPQRIVKHGEKKNPSKEELALIMRDHHNYYNDVSQELFFSNYFMPGKRTSWMCKPIDSIGRNNTKDFGLNEAAQSAEGVI